MNKEFKTAFKRVLCCNARFQLDTDRDAMLDEVSNASRSFQRNVDRIHGGLDVPPTPGFISRTPSATPDTTNWPIVHGNSLMLPSSKPSITINEEESCSMSSLPKSNSNEVQNANNNCK